MLEVPCDVRLPECNCYLNPPFLMVSSNSITHIHPYWHGDITIFDGYPLVIKHGLLENLPFGSTIFPAINIQLWRCLWIFQPATFDDMDGISFYQIHIKCNYISMILCHCTPLYLYYTYYIVYIRFIHSIHSYSHQYSMNLPWFSSWFLTMKIMINYPLVSINSIHIPLTSHHVCCFPKHQASPSWSARARDLGHFALARAVTAVTAALPTRPAGPIEKKHHALKISWIMAHLIIIYAITTYYNILQL